MACKIMKSTKGILFCFHLHHYLNYSVIFDQKQIRAFQRSSYKRQTSWFWENSSFKTLHLDQAFHALLLSC